MSGQRMIRGDDGPAVGQRLDVGTAEREHRLDGHADSDRKLDAAAAGPIVRDLEILVHSGSDAVADVRPDDPAVALDGDVLDHATEAVCSDRDRWVEFMMREELHLSEPDPKRARVSALTIGGSYVAGGAIPLAPYLFPVAITTALAASIAVTLVALALFGAFKGRLTGRPAGAEALRTVLVGALASGAAYTLARLISG